MGRLICIAGKNNIAVNVAEYLRSNHPEVELCAIANRTDDGTNSFQYSFKAYAERQRIPLLQLEDVYDKEDMIFLSLEFDRIVRPSLFKTKELYNIHFSLLPQYKGMYTSALPLLNGESFTGVTFHRIDKGIDTGEIIAQRVVPIESADNCKDLYLKCIQNGTQLVISCLADVINGTVVSHPQPSVSSTYYSKKAIDYAHLSIDFRATAFQVCNQIRAFNFRNYQLPEVEGYEIHHAEITSEPSIEKPGTILQDDKPLLKVATIDYNVILYKDELDGLFKAVRENDWETIRQCKRLKQYINEAENTHGWTLLMVAAYAGNKPLCDYLLQQGASIDSSNINGTTFIMYVKDACLKLNNPEMLYAYIQRGANPFQRDCCGKHLIHYLMDQKPEWIQKILSIQ